MQSPRSVRLPAFVQTLLWAKWPTQTLDFYANRLEEPFTIRLVGNRQYVLVSHPDAVKLVLTKFSEAGNEELRPILGSKSLFLLRGDEHALHRRALKPLFDADAARACAQGMQEITRESLNTIFAGDTICINDLTQRITTRIIVDVLFGLRRGPEAEQAALFLLEATRAISGPAMFFETLQRDHGPWSPGYRLFAALGRVENLIRERMSTRHEKPGGVVAALHEGGQGLSEQAVIDEVKTLLAAGQDPTASAVAWALHWIHADRRVLARLRDELARWSGDASELTDEQQPYLDLVCRETLRIMPIVPAIDRRVPETTDFLGQRLAPEARLVACAYLTHRRQDIFDDALVFSPERFEGRQYSPFEYYPFGGGHRRCIGAFFAPLQMKIMLATLLSRLELRPTGAKVTVVQRGVTLAPSRQLRLTVAGVRA